MNTLTIDRTASPDVTPGSRWVDVCLLKDIVPATGVCARVEGKQVAIFRIGASQDVRAISNRDPFTDANVLSRGLLGDKHGKLKVTSPLLKHAFCLETGQCLDDEAVKVEVYPARVDQERVQVAVM